MSRLIKRLWCALHDHGGMSTMLADGTHARCKKCGAIVKVSPW